MKKTRRSVAITLLLALAIVGVFGVAIAGFSGSSNGGSASSEKARLRMSKTPASKPSTSAATSTRRLCIATSTAILSAWMSRF